MICSKHIHLLEYQINYGCIHCYVSKVYLEMCEYTTPTNQMHERGRTQIEHIIEFQTCSLLQETKMQEIKTTS